ncbi:hypothetical protein [Microbacterium sp. NPDC080220]|uniref:hypothetical protein n=1 Tax=Microbacterium sp. NPDC080220 TaxID=3161017 RepID=UPI00343A912F
MTAAVPATKPRPKVTVETAQHILWVLGDRNLGVDGGHFVNRLLATVSAADLANREKLQAAFPELVDPFVAAQHTTWGLDWLRAVVKRDLDRFDAQLDLPTDLPAGYAEHQGQAVPLPDQYVITKCQRKGPAGEQCVFPPGHAGLHAPSAGRRWV